MDRPAFAFLAGILLTPVSHAQAKPKRREEISGPFYTREHFYSVDIYGLRLGLAPQDAYAVLGARGYSRVVPWSGRELDELQEVRYKSADKAIEITLHFEDVGGKRTLTRYSNDKTYTPAEFADLEGRRRELVGDFGPPTYWHKLVYADGEFNNRFHYDRDGKTFDAKYTALSCIIDWKCATLQNNDNCPDLLRKVGGVIVEGSFVHGRLAITIADMTPIVSALFADPKFRPRDISEGPMCPVVGIH